MPALAFEIENGVNHMLQNAGPGDGALFRHMPHDHHRNAAALGETHQLMRRRAHLTD